MIKRLLLLTIFVSQCVLAFAQLPPPCPSNSTPPSDLCSQTCIYCNFNGVTSSSAGYTSQIPPGFCSGIQNEQWLGFIAGETSATFTAIPSNCTMGNGVQVAVYPSCNGSPLGCNPGQNGGGTTPTSVSVTTMVPGQNYFFMIDGYLADECDFVIVATPPSAITPPIPSAPTQLDGPTSTCPDAVVEYCIPTIPGAAAYTWVAPGDALINGQPSPATIVGAGGNCVTITFGTTSGVICVNGENSCFTGPPLCSPVVVAPIAPTFLADTSICQNELPFITPWGHQVTSTGLYEHTYTTDINCDSIVRQFVFVDIPIPTVLPPTTLCPGESLTVCGLEYFDQGNFDATCVGSSGCDSTVNFTIITPDLEAEITGAQDLSCASPSVTLSYPPSPATPTWYDQSQIAPIGSGTIQMVTDTGVYILELSFTVGSGTCSAFDTVTIGGNITPPPVTSTGGTIGCGSTTQISASTIVTNASYAWSTGATPASSATPTVTTPGSYVVTVTDLDNGCTSTSTADVQGNTDIPTLSIAGNDLNCTTTSATLTATTSASTVTYAWSNSETTSAITVSSGGTYTVTITNPANSCTNSETFTVASNTTQPDITTMSAGMITCLNPSINITSNSNTTGLTYDWGSQTTPDISVNSGGTYTLTVTADNGCTNTASATVAEDVAPPGVTVDNGTLTCAVMSLPLTANTSATAPTFDWGGGNTSSINQVTAAGNYTVTVTGINGCTSTATANVAGDFVTPNATAAGGTITCSVSSINLLGNSTTSGVDFEWTGPNGGIYTDQNPSVSEIGTYTLVVTNPANGCTSTATADVQPDSGIPDASATGGTLDCNNMSITINGSSTTPGVDLTWSGPTGALTGANPTVTAAGTYTLTVEDPTNGCTSIATTTVIEDTDVPQYALTGGQLSCSQANLQLQLVPTGSSVGWTFDWTGAGGLTSTDQNPTVTQPGDYTVIVTAPNGCTSDQLVTVAADNNIPQANTTGGTLTCDMNSVQIQLDITATGTVQSTEWTDASGAPFSTNEDPFTMQAGVYTVVVTTDNGCTSSATATIEEDTTAPDLITTDGVLGCTVSQLQLDATSLAGISYAWIGPNGFTSTDEDPTVNLDGTYTVIVTGANGCTAIETATVLTDFTAADVNIAMPDVLTCGDSVITIQSNITSPSVPIQTVAWTGVGGYTSSDIDPAVTAPGVYDVLVTTTNGCTSTGTITVTEDKTKPDVVTGDGMLTCVQTQTSISATSQTAGATYAWETPNGQITTDQNPIVQSAGTYTVTVTAPNGCTAVSTADVTLDGDFPQNIAIDAPVETITCDNPQIVLTGSSTTPNVVYTWADANNQSLGNDATLTVNTDAVYTLWVTDTTNGCFDNVVQTIAINTTPPDADANGGVVDCLTGTVDLEGISLTPNATFTWLGPNGNPYTGAMPTVSNIGDYNLVVEDPANGCTNTAMVTVQQNTDAPAVTVAGTDELDCATPNVTLTGAITSPPNATGTWTLNGTIVSTDATIMVSDSGTYIYTVINSVNGCQSAPEAVVTADFSEPQVVATGDVITCANPTIGINATSPSANVNFEWTTPAMTTLTGALQSVSVGGTYSVIATGANGCTSQTQTTVNQDITQPDIAVTTQTITCNQPTVVLDAESQTSNVSFAWSGPIVLPNVEDPTTDIMGAYTVVVTDPSNGCTVDFLINVAEDIAAPGVTAQGATLDCTASSVAINSMSTTAGVSYEWFLNGTSISTDQNPSVTEANIYTVIVTNPTNGCTSETTATVVPDSNAPQVSAQGGLLNCTIASIDLTGSSTTTNVTFEWTGPNGFTSIDPNPSVDAAGDYTLVVTALDNGCTSSETTNVAGDFDMPTVDIVQPDMIDCNNVTVTLSSSATGTGTIAFDWTALTGTIESGATSQSPVVGAGNYQLIVTDNSNGCTSLETVTVNADPATPSGAESVVRNVSCFGETDGTVIIQEVQGGTAPFLYSFDNGPFNAQSQWTNLLPRVYPVTVQDALGCEWETEYEVIEPEELFLDLGADLTLELGDSVQIGQDMVINFPGRVEQFVVLPPDFYEFICDTCGTTYYQAFYTKSYEVTILDSNGCKAVDERLIIVDRTRNVYVPNVFNPNAPDINALLTVHGNTKHVTNIKSFKLYDRWGELVYEAYDFPPNSYDQAWDGRYQEKRVNPSVFIWVAEIEFVDGLVELYKGDVTVTGN